MIVLLVGQVDLRIGHGLDHVRDGFRERAERSEHHLLGVVVFAGSRGADRLIGIDRDPGALGLARDALAPLAGAGRPGRVNRELVGALGEHGLLARLLPSASSAPGAQPR